MQHWKSMLLLILAALLILFVTAVGIDHGKKVLKSEQEQEEKP